MISSYVLYTAGLALLVAFALFVRWYVARRSLHSDARAEYADRAATKPGTVKEVNEAQFVSLYVSAHQPLWALYAAGALTLAVVLSPVILLLVTAVYEAIWQAAGAPEWAGRGGYAFMFALFFGTIFLWALIGGAFARAYHKRSAEPFTHALARARGEPIPDEIPPEARPRPAWARRVRPDPEPDSKRDEETER